MGEDILWKVGVWASLGAAYIVIQSCQLVNTHRDIEYRFYSGLCDSNEDTFLCRLRTIDFLRGFKFILPPISVKQKHHSYVD
jgi:hypothetical protein